MTDKTPNDGGPAFPVAHPIPSSILGMTLRDWFAGQALAGITRQDERQYGKDPYENMAMTAYAVADKMLTEKQRREGQ